MQNTGPQHDDSTPASYALIDGTRTTPAVDDARSYSSTGRLPEVRRLGLGQYVITFPDIGKAAVAPQDTSQVTAVGELPRYCAQLGWNNAIATVGVRTVGVACYDEAGRLADARFSVVLVHAP